MNSFSNKGNASIVMDIIDAIKRNKNYLSDIDGLIGDGDHGINMNKGFSIAGQRISDDETFSSAMKILGDTLLLEIGGSMGPIYGTFFRTCALKTKDLEEIAAPEFCAMLESANEKVKGIGGAKVGDKTLIDTLEPAVCAMKSAVADGLGFKESLSVASEAAENGKESTKGMVAKIGRASRLGERSRGVLDAGATSCCIILKSMMESVSEKLGN